MLVQRFLQFHKDESGNVDEDKVKAFIADCRNAGMTGVKKHDRGSVITVVCTRH